MPKEILYILLPQFADHEIPFLAMPIASDDFAMKENPKFINKVVAPTMDLVQSIGGFRVLPDYTFENIPENYAAIVLVGGYGWFSPVAEKTLPLIKDALAAGKPVGAICNGASFLAKAGVLNEYKHTGNGIDQLKYWGGENYHNEAGYIQEQAVRDRNLVTANGSGALEFSKEMLLLLESDTPENIERFYQFHKLGFTKLFS